MFDIYTSFTFTSITISTIDCTLIILIFASLDIQTIVVSCLEHQNKWCCNLIEVPDEPSVKVYKA